MGLKWRISVLVILVSMYMYYIQTEKEWVVQLVVSVPETVMRHYPDNCRSAVLEWC